MERAPLNSRHINGDVDAMDRLVEAGLVKPGKVSILQLTTAWRAYAGMLEAHLKVIDPSGRLVAYEGGEPFRVRSALAKVRSEWMSVSKLKNIAWLLNEVAA